MDLNASLGQSVALRLFRAPLNEHLIFAKHLTAAVKTEEFLAGKGLVTRGERVRCGGCSDWAPRLRCCSWG